MSLISTVKKKKAVRKENIFFYIQGITKISGRYEIASTGNRNKQIYYRNVGAEMLIQAINDIAEIDR